MVTPQIKELGRWMVMEAPDREVVKMGNYYCIGNIS